MSFVTNAAIAPTEYEQIISEITAQKPTIRQLTTMISTSKNVLFPGPNLLLTTGADDPSLDGTRVIIKESGH